MMNHYILQTWTNFFACSILFADYSSQISDKIHQPGSLEYELSPADEGWQRLTAVLNFGVLKRIQTLHS